MTRPLQRLLLLSAILLRVSGVAAFTPAASVGAKAYSLSASTVVSPPAIENTNDSDDDEAVEFPPPLSSVDRLKRAATFWSVAVPIVANYYGKFAEMKLREGLLGETMSDEEIEVRASVSSHDVGEISHLETKWTHLTEASMWLFDRVSGILSMPTDLPS